MRACGFAFAVRSIRSCQNACTELLIVGVDAGVGVGEGHGGCLSSPVSLISVSKVDVCTGDCWVVVSGSSSMVMTWSVCFWFLWTNASVL